MIKQTDFFLTVISHGKTRTGDTNDSCDIFAPFVVMFLGTIQRTIDNRSSLGRKHSFHSLMYIHDGYSA